MLNKPIDLKIGIAKKFYPVPADKYTLQIMDVNEVDSPFEAGKKMLNFAFIILDNKDFEYTDGEGEKQIESTRGRRLWKDINPSLSDGKIGKASWFYKLLSAVEKADIAVEKYKEVDGMELANSLVDQQVLAMVEATSTGYNNILSFAPVAAQLEPIPLKEQLAEIPEEELPL